jgi:hypothetical protein
MTTRYLRAAVAGAILFALSGCAGSTASTPAATATPQMSYDDGLLTFELERAADGSYASNAARYEGRLSFDAGCVLVGGHPLAVARPASWDGETLTIGDESFALGDELVMSGGYRANRLPEEPDECGGKTFFADSVQLLADEL